MGDREVDRELVGRAQRGDKQAFELLVVKYQHRLARVISRFVRDPGETEDVTQEAFIKAYRALPSFRNESAFYTWLYRVAINSAKNHLVARARQLPTTTGFVSIADLDANGAASTEKAESNIDVNTPEAELESREIIESVERTVQALPEELATAITLREIVGLTYEEIAEVMNCPVGTVRSRIFRAREAIAQTLRPLLGVRTGRGW